VSHDGVHSTGPALFARMRQQHCRALNLRRCRHGSQRWLRIIVAMRPHAATSVATVVRSYCVGARRGQHPPWLPAHRAQTMRHRIPMLVREPPRECSMLNSRCSARRIQIRRMALRSKQYIRGHPRLSGWPHAEARRRRAADTGATAIG
jgi:hypothetical protein